MSDETIKSSEGSSLNVEGFDNRPLCPVCQGYLVDADSDYEYRRVNPDTRWFWCEACAGHLGYHRMKRNWLIDPHDLNTSESFREFFSLTD